MSGEGENSLYVSFLILKIVFDIAQLQTKLAIILMASASDNSILRGITKTRKVRKRFDLRGSKHFRIFRFCHEDLEI